MRLCTGIMVSVSDRVGVCTISDHMGCSSPTSSGQRVIHIDSDDVMLTFVFLVQILADAFSYFFFKLLQLIVCLLVEILPF